MIIDASQGNIETIGDIKEFKTSIDPRNIDFITTLLSSNLYSNPEQSFIREIVSNAWDSHVEAGTTDIPVIIRFTKRSIIIRDYGTGLSPERFKEVYCNIGSSTKRESNKFIGAFGIGKYSTLACSNTVYITSYYEGTEYHYIMVKDGNTITTNLVMEMPTEKANGVSVSIDGVTNFRPYNEALYSIVFFPNIYIDGANDAKRINDSKIKWFTNFAASSIPIRDKLLLGNVLYPIDIFQLSDGVRSFISRIRESGIVLKFNIGEIEVTPNRETIIYSPKTIKLIEQRAMDAEKELDALVKKKVSGDYDDIIQYFSVISSTNSYDPVNDALNKMGFGYNVYIRSLDTNITCMGIDLRPLIYKGQAVLGTNLPGFKGYLFRGGLYKKRLPYSKHLEDTMRAESILVVDNKITPTIREYLASKYDCMSIVQSISYRSFIKYISGFWTTLGMTDEEKPLFRSLVKAVYKSLVRRSTVLDLDNDAGLLEYKKEKRANRTVIPVFTKNWFLYTPRHGIREKLTFCNSGEVVKYLKRRKQGIILTTLEGNDEILKALAELKGYMYLKARKEIVEYLRSLGLSCLVDINWLLNKDPLLSRVKAIVKNFPGKIDSISLAQVMVNLDNKTKEEFREIVRLDDTYGSNYVYRSLVASENIPVDSYTDHVCKKIKYYLDKHYDTREIVLSMGEYNPVMNTAVVIKTKAYRVDKEAYMKYRNNKLINILCRK